MKAHLGSCLILKLEFHLLDLKDPLGVNGVDFPLHEFVKEYVFSRNALLEEIFQVLFVFLNIVVLLPGRSGLGRIEYGLRVA